MRYYYLLFFVFCLSGFANAQTNEDDKKIRLGKGSRFHEVVRLPGHFLHLNSNKKSKELDITRLEYGTHTKQYMLVCRSKEVAPTKENIIFFIHGGGWHIGKPEQHILLAELLAEQGYVVVLPAYRLTPEADYYDMRWDISHAFKTALAYAQTDPELKDKKVVVGGASAGANLGALLVYDKKEQTCQDIDPKIFAGFFSFAGALDIETMKYSKVLQRYAGDKDSPTFASANPKNHLDVPINIPIMCVHGDKDGLVDYKTALNYAQELCKLSCSWLDFYTIPKGTHLSVGTQWYYKKRKNIGQSDYLLNWLEKIQVRM
jgi:acetyl esterase/lipase